VGPQTKTLGVFPPFLQGPWGWVEKWASKGIIVANPKIHLTRTIPKPWDPGEKSPTKAAVLPKLLPSQSPKFQPIPKRNLGIWVPGVKISGGFKVSPKRGKKEKGKTTQVTRGAPEFPGKKGKGEKSFGAPQA